MAAQLPKNAELAEQFDLLADLLELEGAESFRVLAYRRAATRMRETSGSIAQLALDGRAKELAGIGKTIEEKIVQIVDRGEIEALSKRKPSFDSTVAFVSPCATRSTTQGRPVKNAVSSPGSVAVAMMSRSRNVSFRRRTEPASETCTAAGCSRSTETTACTAGRPRPSSFRPASGFSAWNASAFRIFSSLFEPSPGSARRRSASAAVLSSSSVEMPSSFQMRAAVFGPSPGSRMNSTTSWGIVDSRFASASIFPVSTIWTIFSSIVLPMPCSSFARPSSASCATEPDVSRIRVAARR